MMRRAKYDHYVSPIRVAATSAVGCKYMARENSQTLGIVGTGFQAQSKVEAIWRVRPIRQVKAYSPNKDNCGRFAEMMSKRLGIEVKAVDDARAVVQGSDIVVAVTNSAEPVFNGEWLEEGTHVISTIGANRFDQRREIDDETVRRSSLVVVNLKEQVEIDAQPELMSPIRKGYLRWEDIHELGDLVTGKIVGRRRASEITHHNNNVGMGIQFAAAGAVIYEKARKEGRGTELPLELFMTSREGEDSSAP
jgi:ornithine cyclodeaminase/alanine dehydrogenase-like protein (mu-crystallin family)